MSVSDISSQSTPVHKILAAIDLGSNSFHLVVSKNDNNHLNIIDVMSEKVQLAAGFDEQSNLSEEAMQRGLECLGRFAERIKELPRESVRIVGTNALREAKNCSEFLERAEKVINIPLEVIAGREEARLIYLGVSHTQADSHGQKLVVDIGGGSTEFIIGEGFEAGLLESLHMGCVSFDQSFFSDGEISKKRFDAARTAALQEIQVIRYRYRRKGWDRCIGSSGTIKAIFNACKDMGAEEDYISAKMLSKVTEKLLSCKHVDELPFSSIKAERLHILPAGLAILSAIFDSLSIERMYYSDSALREGLLYDMIGRLQHEDVRQRTIDSLCRRYHVDQQQANRVEHTALIAWAQVKDNWDLNRVFYHDLLRWAAATHEIGLTIAHNQFHKHSAYLLQNSDLSGFTNLEQLMLSVLARSHRRKFPKDEEFKALPAPYREPIKRLCVLLRLAVIMHRSRSKARTPLLMLNVSEQKISLNFPGDWLKHHPLTSADMEQERNYLKQVDFDLEVS